MISVIIPLYNKEQRIKATVESVLSQTFSDFEIIIVNDGSTDDSVNRVSSLKDLRIRIINKENGGVSSARNRGAREAAGDWLLFLDADDLIYPNCLASLAQLSTDYPEADILTGNFETVYSTTKKIINCRVDEKRYIENPFRLIWEKKWNMRLGSFLLRKTLFRKMGGFHPIMTIGEDTYFVYELLLQSKSAYTPQVVMSYLREYSSLSGKSVPFNKRIEYYFTLRNDIFYKRMIEAELLFKQIFQSLLRKDVCCTRDLLKKYYNALPVMLRAEFFRLRTKILTRKRTNNRKKLSSICQC